MRQSAIWLLCLFVIVTLTVPGWSKSHKESYLTLSQPASDGEISVERAIEERRTIRAFRPDPLSMDQLSQLLWAAQGVTDERRGFRAAPSGGALYPLDVYAVVGEKGGMIANRPFGGGSKVSLRNDPCNKGKDC